MSAQEFFIDTSIDYDERFTMAKFMEYVSDNFEPLTSHIITEIKKLPIEGTYVYKSINYRLDVLAKLVYDDEQFWWVLMIYNEFDSADKLVYNTNVKYPSLTDIEQLYYSLKLKQAES